MNLRILVCQKCYDEAQEQLRPKILPSDPVPVFNPRPENYAEENEGIPATETGVPIIRTPILE